MLSGRRGVDGLARAGAEHRARHGPGPARAGGEAASLRRAR